LRGLLNDRHLLFIGLLLAISIIVFANTLGNSFMWEDGHLITENSYIKNVRKIPSLFTFYYWRHHQPRDARGLYAPVTASTFALDYSIWKTNPFGYHLTNLISNALNVLLVYYLVLLLQGAGGKTGGDPILPLLAALLFAVHPIHTESVAWISKRSYVLASLFFLSAAIFFIKYISSKDKRSRLTLFFAAIFSSVLALCSKETAISLPFVLALYALCFPPAEGRRWAILRTLPFFGLAAAYLFLNKIVFHAGDLPGVASDIRLYPHALSVVKTIGYYGRLLLFPVNLNAERTFRLPGSIFEPAVISSIILLFLLLVVIIKASTGPRRKASRLLSFALLFTLLTLLPVSNIIFIEGRAIAEQRLYIPSIGFCIILAMGIDWLRLRMRSRVPFLLLLMPILLFYSVTTIRRNLDWKDPITFWSKTVESSPDSFRAHNNLGRAYGAYAIFDKSLASFKKAIEINPGYADPYYNLGVAYNNIGRLNEAMVLLMRAVELDPDIAAAHTSLGIVSERLGRPEEAITYYKQAIEVDAHYAESYVRLGTLYSGAGKQDDALRLFKEAIDADPYHGKAYNNLAATYNRMGMRGEAIELFKKSIEMDPGYAEPYFNLAIIYSRIGDTEEAIDLYKRAITVKPDHAKAYYNLGFLYNAAGMKEEAIEAYKDAIEIDKDYAKAHNNLADAYYSVGEYSLAIEHCDRALELGHEADPEFLNILKAYRRQEADDGD
jgi:tetratricopeptide (TPR) repeat protein